MYTYEERMAAVQLYIESGCSEKAVTNELGYPSPNVLRQWYKEFKATGTLHGKVNRQKFYSPEQISTAVAYYDEHGGSIISVCRALGYPERNTMRKWILDAHPNEAKQVGKHCKSNEKLIRCSLEQKQAAVEAWISGTPDYKVAAQYGVSRAALYAWKKKLLGKVPVKMGKKEEAAYSEEVSSDKAALQAELKALQAEVHRRKMELDILLKAAEVVKKGKGISLENMTNAEKAGVIGALNGEYRLCELLEALSLSKSSYYYQKKAASRPDKYGQLRESIKEAFEENYQCYGYRRLHLHMKKSGQIVSEKVIRRIMRDGGLVAHCARKRRYNSYMGEVSPAVPNVLNRHFHAAVPNEKWLTDITEFAIPAGKVYLSPIIDCFDGSAVSWSIGTNPNAQLVNTMLDHAIAKLGKGEKPIVHSDRGGHYRWPGWIERMDKAQLQRSMSKKGCSPDNAACEGFFGRLKNEMFYGREWMGVSITDFIAWLNTYIRWYNEKRIKLTLGGLSPLAYRRSLGLAV